MYTLETMLRLFADETSCELSAATQQNYRYALMNLQEHLGNSTNMLSISRADLISWRANIADRYAVTTANTYIRVARRFFRWAVEYIEDETGDVVKNPARKLKLIKTTELEPRAIEHQDVMKLLAEAYRDNNLRNQAIVMFLYATGGRVGGLIGLRLDDLELENGRAWVVEKGNKGRWVYLPDMAVETLQNYIRYHRPRLKNVDAVFVSQRRTPLTRHGVWHVLRTMARRAGVTGAHNPHAFRHAFAIAYLKNGGDLSSLSRLLGHSAIAVTHTNYGRWAESDLQEQHGRYSPFNGLSLPDGEEK